MFDKLTPSIYLENNKKHTNIVEESDELFVSLQKQNKMAPQYTGIFEASIRWISSHGRKGQSGASFFICFALLFSKYGLVRAVKYSRERTSQW